MNQYFGLMYTISNEFRIRKGATESEKSWKARILYSYLGQIAYSSLFDIKEDLKPASIIHFKSRISDSLSSMLEMYPELKGVYSADDESLYDEIYDIFLKTGCIYHEPNRITPCVKKECAGTHILFMRGQAVESKRFLSGLGSYLLSAENDASITSLDEMFSLQTKPLDQLWGKIIACAKFDEAPTDLDLEYLRINPPFNRGYWVNMPDTAGNVSIARTGLPGGRIYYLYRVKNSKLFISQLPEWQTENFNYRALAVGDLYTRGVLPDTGYSVDGDVVTLRIGYLFPPAEMNLIKLYSWPLSYKELPHDFTRVMCKNVFEELRNLFEHLGYGFKEEL